MLKYMAVHEHNTNEDVILEESELTFEPIASVSSLNVDQLLTEYVGAFGIWQWGILFLTVFSSPLMTTFPAFVNAQPDHRCLMPTKAETIFKKYNLTFNDISTIVGPNEEDGGAFYYGCSYYIMDWENDTAVTERINNYLNYSNTNDKLVTCSIPCNSNYLYNYNQYQYPNSIVAEFNLVCQNKWISPVGTTLFMVGMIIGCILGGYCGDKYGRRYTAITFSLIEIAAAIGTSLSPNHYYYHTFRTIIGITNGAKSVVLRILPIELTMAKYRSYFTSAIIFGVTGIHRMILSVEAYFIPNWRFLHATYMMPCLGCFLFFVFLPESPRWLLSQFREKETLNTLQKGCQMNHLFCKDKSKLIHFNQFIANYNATHLENAPNKSRRSRETWNLQMCIKSIQRFIPNCYLLKTIILSTLLVTMQTFAVFGLLLYSRLIKDYIYLVTFINAVMSIPGPILASIVFRFVRYRRNPLIVSYLIASGALLLGGIYTYTANSSSDVILNICTNIALIMLSTTVIMLYIYMAELFPSNVRTFGVGVATGLGRFGSLVSTFVNVLDDVEGHGIPIIVYGVALFCQIIFLGLLKDTSGENLSDRSDQVVKKKSNIKIIANLQRVDK